MVETDHDALAVQYENIPTPTDAHDEKALSELLLTSVKNLAIKENDKDARHNFFIGLAYLTGIDVEVDHKRAVSLITSAAEAGLIEAIDKLIRMYEEGEGVERNYETAVAWREKKIVRQEQIYREVSNDRRLNTLFWTVIECGDAYKALGKLSPAREKYALGQQLLEDSGRQGDNKNILRNVSVSYSKLGDICASCGDLAGARAYYEKAQDIREQLAKETGTVESYDDLAVSYYKVAAISEGDAQKEYLQKSIDLYETLCRACPGVARYQKNLKIIRSALQ
jgi:TPR repeat protein